MHIYWSLSAVVAGLTWSNCVVFWDENNRASRGFPFSYLTAQAKPRIFEWHWLGAILDVFTAACIVGIFVRFFCKSSSRSPLISFVMALCVGFYTWANTNAVLLVDFIRPGWLSTYRWGFPFWYDGWGHSRPWALITNIALATCIVFLVDRFGQRRRHPVEA